MKITSLTCDFETSSEIDLKTDGLDKYARHKSTRVLMLGAACNQHPPHLWQPHLGPMPSALRAMLDDPAVEIHAFNAAFERAIFRHVLGVDVALERFVCSQAMAVSLALPDDLARLAREGLRLPADMQKDSEGKKLINLFCVPNKPTKARPQAWNDWTTHPVEWERFGRYCLQDVTVERKAFAILSRYLPDLADMRRWWCLGQRINERGVPVDRELVRGAQIVADETKAVLWDKMKAVSGLDNPNSPAQAQVWLNDRGYPYSNLRKERVQMALDYENADLTPEAVTFLELRQMAAKTSVTKLEAIERAVADDGRLRYMFQFRAASRTGRYGGRVVQLQNLARPHHSVRNYLADARDILRAGDYDTCAALFDSPLDVVSSSIRSALCATPGKKLVVADLAAIELAVLAWLAGAKFWLNVLKEGRDPYKSFGVHFLGKPYEQITKQERDDCKPGTLGSGFMLGGGFLSTDKNNDIIRTGLWGYAENMGIALTQEQAKESVRIYRAVSPEVVNFWHNLSDAVLDTIRDQQPRTVRGLVIDIKAPFLRIRLPSGRRLHYLRPKIETRQVRSGNNEDGTPKFFTATNMTYEGIDQTTRQWVRMATHAGKLTENVVQAIALDVLNQGLEFAEEDDFDTVLHVHDEIGTLCDEDDSAALPRLIGCMTRKVPWMDGLPLKAEGYEAQFYRKG